MKLKRREKKQNKKVAVKRVKNRNESPVAKAKPVFPLSPLPPPQKLSAKTSRQDPPPRQGAAPPRRIFLYRERERGTVFFGGWLCGLNGTDAKRVLHSPIHPSDTPAEVR